MVEGKIIIMQVQWGNDAVQQTYLEFRRWEEARKKLGECLQPGV